MILLVNELADLDVLVVFITSGSGIFNADARRLSGLHQRIPREFTDPSVLSFKVIRDHYGLDRFEGQRVRYADLLQEGKPFICLTIKDLQGRSGQITPKDSGLPNRIGTRAQRGLHALKSDLDITGNIVDLICYNKCEVSRKILYLIISLEAFKLLLFFRWNQSVIISWPWEVTQDICLLWLILEI